MADDVYEICIYSHKDKEVNEGNIVTLTTSQFSYDNLRGIFTDDVEYKGQFLCKYLDSDYSEYEEGKHLTGGKYGYAYFVVVGEA